MIPVSTDIVPDFMMAAESFTTIDVSFFTKFVSATWQLADRISSRKESSRNSCFNLVIICATKITEFPADFKSNLYSQSVSWKIPAD